MGWWSKARKKAKKKGKSLKKAGKSFKSDAKKRAKSVKSQGKRFVKDIPARGGRVLAGQLSTIEGVGRTAMNVGEAIGEAGSAVLDTGIAGAHTAIGTGEMMAHSLGGGGARIAGEAAGLGSKVVAGGLRTIPVGSDSKMSKRADRIEAKGKKIRKSGKKAQIASAGRATKAYGRGLKRGRKSLQRAKKSITKGIPKQLGEAGHSALYTAKSAEVVARAGSSGEKAKQLEAQQRKHRKKSGGAWLGAETPLDAAVGVLSVPGAGAVVGKGVKVASRSKVGKNVGSGAKKIVQGAGKKATKRIRKSKAGRGALKHGSRAARKFRRGWRSAGKGKKYSGVAGAAQLARKGAKMGSRAVKAGRDRVAEHLAERQDDRRRRGPLRGSGPKY